MAENLGVKQGSVFYFSWLYLNLNVVKHLDSLRMVEENVLKLNFVAVGVGRDLLCGHFGARN